MSAEERERRLKAMQTNAQLNANDRVARLEERRKESAREAAVLIEKAKAAKGSYGVSCCRLFIQLKCFRYSQIILSPDLNLKIINDIEIYTYI